MNQAQKTPSSQSMSRSNDTRKGGESEQIERILKWIICSMAAGMLILALHAATLDAWFDRWRFFSIGALSALVSATGGGALGLLFGLPISGLRAARNNIARDRNDWFSDNASMEEIADWLTKIIVGLTLTQWASIQNQFNRMAAAVSEAMTIPSGAVPAAVLSAMRGDAAMVPGGIIIGAYSALGFVLVYLWARRYLAEALALARGASRKVQKESDDDYARRAQHEGAVQMMTKSVQAQADAEKQANAAQAEIGKRDVEPSPAEAPTSQPEPTGSEGSSGEGLPNEQGEIEASGEGDAPGYEEFAEVVAPTKASSKLTPSTGGSETPNSKPEATPFNEVVRPGPNLSDPWRGQFGGKPLDDRVEVTAQVRPFESDPDLFAIEVRIRPLGILRGLLVRNLQARIYLHPTFDHAIREEKFDHHGEISLPLVGYGAFTLGVQTQWGTLLELDLAQLPDAPRKFKAN